MERAYEWLYRRLGHRYLTAIAGIEASSAMLIALGTIGVFQLYVDMTAAEFWRILFVTELLVVCALCVGARSFWTSWLPLRQWVRGEREGLDPAAVWRSTISVPLDLVTRGEKMTICLVALPAAVFGAIELKLHWYAVPLLLVGSLVSIAYAAVLEFFASEVALRPIVREVAPLLPDGFAPDGSGVPLRWKLLGSLPLINVITGVIVSGLSAGDRSSLAGLGVSVLVAVLVASTLSLELTVLVSRSVLMPVRDLIAATERVKAGDFSARVPVVSGDEMGTLALSFNQMMRGLSEREALHDAFASYVDPQVAQRVLEEGTHIAGEEAEVTLAFVDIRDFTSFAERSSAREAVAYVNEFLELVVPIVTRHGGHANKFVGDGLLAVFGAPARLPDHADRALAAAAEIAGSVREHFGERLQIGVGVSSGTVLAGTVGGGGKLDFTVIGDAVNVASRVEEVTRATGDTVLLTEATKALSSDARLRLEARGAISLKGRSDPVRIYALVDSGAAMVQHLTGATSGMRSGR
ncbi:MAG TPA: adenylate/guanylate cyclase domain-containing protein [Thermoleophilaceae bacterium]